MILQTLGMKDTMKATELTHVMRIVIVSVIETQFIVHKEKKRKKPR